MHKFHSDYLIGGFFVFIALFFTIVLLDFLYQLCKKYQKSPQLVYGQHDSFRFHLKRRLARLLLAFNRKKCDPTLDLAKLQVFSDLDEMVSVFHFRS